MDQRFLADVLPHDVIVDEQAGMVLLSTPRPLRSALAVGCAWDIVPLNVEVADEAVCLDLARQHESLLRGLPIGAALQVLWTLRPVSSVPHWEALRAGVPADVHHHPLLVAQHAAIRHGLPHADGQTLHHLRASTTLVTLRVPLPSVSPALGALLRAMLNTPARTAQRITTLLQAHLAEHLVQVESAALGVQESLRAAGHQVQRLRGSAIAAALARALDPLADELPALNPELPLRHQVRTRDGLTPAQDRWVFPHDPVPLATQVLTLHQPPPKTYPGMLSSARAPLNVEPLALWDVWPGPLTIAVNIASPAPAVEKGRLQRRLALATVQQALSVENRRLKGQLEELLGNLFVSGRGVTWGRIHLVAWGAPDRVQRETPALIRVPRRLGLEFGDEPILGSTFFLQTLPLGFDPAFPVESSLQRGRRLSQENLVDLLPLYGSFAGTPTASVLYVNRQGQGVGFSPLDMLTNRHFIVKGGSGSGKSFNVGYFLNHVLPLGAKACIIDDLPSYADLCETWGGHNLVMTYNAPLCNNPFYGPLDADHTSHAHEMIAYMMSGGREDQRLDQESSGVLAQAVGHFAALHRGGAEPTLSGFVQTHLLDAPWSADRHERAIARSLARRLGKFVGNGSCAGFVDGPNTFRLHDVLTVLQLSEIHDDDLKGVLVLGLMNLLRVVYASPATWGIPKYFICDETFALLDTPSIAKLLVKVAVTQRKLGVSSGFISPHASHFSGPIGRVLKDIASIKIFLAHEASEIDETAEVFQWSEAEKTLFVRGDVARHDDWSSAYLSFGDKQGGVVRIVADPVTRWMLTQRDTERRLRAEAIAKADGDRWAAMAQLAAQYPQGVR